MGTKLQGIVLWDDNNEPVVNAPVAVFNLRDGAVLATSRTGRDGTFKAQLKHSADDERRCEAVFFGVTSAGGSQLLLTRDLPTPLTSEAVQVQLAVPRERSDERQARRKPTVCVGEFELDAEIFARLEPGFVLELALAIADPKAEKAVAPRIKALSPAIVPSVHAARRLSQTALLELIEEIIRIKKWPRDLRLRVDEILRGRVRTSKWPGTAPEPPTSGFAQVHLCPNFSITYQDSGPDAISLTSTSLSILDPGNPVSTVLAGPLAGPEPDYIKRICFWLERALAAYTGPRFNLRNPAAGGRIPVVVNSAAFGSAGATTFFINKALPPDVLCAVCVHELFHMVHQLYTGSGPWQPGTNEGGAVWAEDSAAEFLNRYLDEAGTNFNGSGYMVQPHTSLEDTNFRYKTSLFWRYIAEQQSAFVGAADEPMIGVETFREVLQQCEASGWSSNAVRDAVRNLPWYQDFYEFEFLDPARLDRLRSENLFGNFALAAYLKELGVNVPDRRFDFMEDQENIAIDDVILTMIPGTPLQTTLASVARAGTGTVTAGTAVNFSSNVPRFGSRYFEVNVDPGVTSVQLQFTAGGGLTSVQCQAVLIDQNNQVREIYRSDATNYSKRFPNLRGGIKLNRVAVVVSGCASAGSFTLGLSNAAAAPDVMVTRWHSVMKNEYEIDPRNWSWTWVSPDIYVDTNLDAIADGTVFFNVNNKLFIRLHNKGNANATGIDVQFWYQNAAAGLSNAGWLPVKNVGGIIQSLSGLTLAAGASNAWSVDWAPVQAGASQHFCVRAVVTVPGDPNTDNKRVVSNFGNVQVQFGGFIDVAWLRRHAMRDGLREVSLSVVPRFAHQFELAPRDLEEQRVKRLKPDEAVVDLLRVYHRPSRADVTRTAAARPSKDKDPCPCAGPARASGREPDPTGDYPVDARTLPPGLEGKPMVTLVHRTDGQVIGGITLMLTVEKG
jgi:hypothetical protein